MIFNGGELLYRDDFFDIAKYASTKGLRIIIGSNGRLIDPDIARRLKSSGIMAVQISIDGAKACKEVGWPFQFRMAIRRGTVDEIPNMLKLAIDYGTIAAEFFDLLQVPRVKRELPTRCYNQMKGKKL
ncbi:MAG: radical SAM protein [candidate division WOR-3 bacterium]